VKTLAIPGDESSSTTNPFIHHKQTKGAFTQRNANASQNMFGPVAQFPTSRFVRIVLRGRMLHDRVGAEFSQGRGNGNKQIERRVGEQERGVEQPYEQLGGENHLQGFRGGV